MNPESVRNLADGMNQEKQIVEGIVNPGSVESTEQQPKKPEQKLTPAAQRLVNYMRGGEYRVEITSKYAPHNGNRKTERERRRYAKGLVKPTINPANNHEGSTVEVDAPLK